MIVVPGWQVWAQHLPGIAMSNYAGINALYHNPAFVADSRYNVHVNVAGAQMYVGNNYVKYGAPFSMFAYITDSANDKYKNSRGQVEFPRTYLIEKLNGKPKYLNTGGDLRLPSIMFNLFHSRVGIAFSSRGRFFVNASEVTEPIARVIAKTTRPRDLRNTLYENQSGRLHMNGFGEVAFTLGGVLMNNETQFLKVGATVKRLIGLYTAHVIIDQSSFRVLPDQTWDNRKQYISVDEIHVKYAITRDAGYENVQPAWLLSNGPPGSGWGFDIGAVYEIRPDIQKFTYREKGERKQDPSKNKYKYRIAASLTDIGKIHFRNPAYVIQQETHAVNKEFRFDNFQDLDGSEGLYNAINTALEGGPSLAPNFRSVLPAAFQASVDYHHRDNIYVNALWVQNMIPKDAFGMKAESVLSVTPRYEHKWYEFSVPLSLLNHYRSPAIGLAGRAGPVWIGTDNLTAMLNIGNPRAFSFYFGLSAGLYRQGPESQIKCWPPQDSWLRRIFTKR
ncbi:DUF5723 family protein [Dyadobacter sandarakinus]|nr:DUF5723 family protein [Dyadobacter sandarakinus]